MSKTHKVQVPLIKYCNVQFTLWLQLIVLRKQNYSTTEHNFLVNKRLRWVQYTCIKHTCWCRATCALTQNHNLRKNAACHDMINREINIINRHMFQHALNMLVMPGSLLTAIFNALIPLWQDDVRFGLPRQLNNIERLCKQTGIWETS